jgi:hypothetical protein
VILRAGTFLILGLAAASLLVLPIAVVGGLLLGVAFITRTMERLLTNGPEAEAWQAFVEYEPTIGWRLKANLDAHGRADDMFHVTTGPDGWRGSLLLDDADMVVFGDSYAFGHGADDDKMYSARAGDLRVKPIGSDGYDMVQGLLWMERYAERLRGKGIIWFVYYGNDLWENLLPTMGHYRKPYLRRGSVEGWEVATEHISREPWPFPASRNYHEPLAEICSDTPLSKLVSSSCEYLIRRADDICRTNGAHLTVVGIPDRVQLTSRGRLKLQSLAPDGISVDPLRPDQMLDTICDRLGVPFQPLSERLGPRDYLLQDIHWTASGHRKVGALLRELDSALMIPGSMHDRGDRID